MKKIFAIVLSTLLLIGGAGCGLTKLDPDSMSDIVISGGSDSAGNDIINPDKDMDGVLNVAVPNVTSHINAMDAFVKSYNEKFPNIKVNVTKYDLDQYKGKITDVAAASQALNSPEDMYDIFWIPQDYVNEWYSLRILGSLEDLIAQDPDVSKDMLISAAVESSSVNGSMYMMPRDYNQVVMYYNKTMFDVAQVDYPTSKMSADEFREMLELLREGLCTSSETNDYGVRYKDKVGCIIDCNVKWDSLAWPLLKSFGSTIVDENGEVTFNSDETIAAFKYWKSLTEDVNFGCRLAIKIETGGTNPGNQFRMQQAPIYFQARAVISDIVTDATIAGQKYYGVKNIDVAGLPQFGDTYTIGGGCSGYAIYSQVAHVTEAWQFLKHVVSLEGQNAYSKTGDCVPVRRDLLENENAAWRTSLADVLPKKFHHEAFIENMDAYASTRDFYQYIPLRAQSKILAKIEETFNAMSSLTTEANMRLTLAGYADAMAEIIRKAKA